MKRTIILTALISLFAHAIPAQVKFPFDVPLPTWKMLVEARSRDNSPYIHQMPNWSSKILISLCGEDCDYQWATSSTIPEWWEKTGLYGTYPLITKEGIWANLDLSNLENGLSGWVPKSDLRSVDTFKLTKQDISNSNYILTWEESGEIYALVESGACVENIRYSIGKLCDGYIVCPYSCWVEMDPNSRHPGILNGVVGGMSSVKKFTRKDLNYILNQATEGPAPLIVYGYWEDGEKSIGTLFTHLVSTSATTDKTEDNEIYTSYETEPQFPGGMAGIFKHIALKMNYPVLAQENNIQGRVIVSLVIEKDGSVGDVTVVQKVDPSLDKEAVRVVKTLPKFTNPAKINDRPVRYKMNLPITFRLN